MRKPIRLIFLCLPLILLILSSCKGNNSSQDPNAIYTSAAQTVSVKLTENASTLPSPTSTNTQALLASPTEGTQTSPAVISTTPALAATTPVPTQTITSAPVNDRAEFVSQDPLDGSILSANQSFTMTWTIKNSGLTTWTTAYQLRFFSADRLGSNLPTAYPLTKEVAPGESIQLSVPMIAPSQPGEYTSNWVITNANQINFYPLYVTIKVTSATVTPIPTITNTITLTPTVTETTTITTP